MRVLAIALVIGFTSTLTGQAPQPSQPTPPGQPAPGQPTRMPARPLRPGEAPPKGTAVLRGYVTAAGSGTPLRRVQVSARAMDANGGGGVTSTDSEGRFEIKELTAGRYMLFAQKGGFVSSQYGQRRPNEQGTPIELVDGQTVDKLNFALARGGVIAGRILDDGGDPVSGTQVMAVRYAFMGGSRRLMPAQAEGGNDRTDDQGGYRLFGLPPGDYYVSAVNRSGLVMMVGGNNTEADGFAPTYFPGTPNIGEAARVTVKAGAETSASFAMIVARMARLRGRALNSKGEPIPRMMLMLTPGDPTQTSMMMNMNNAMVRPDGGFEFANVPPGRYNIQARPMGMPEADAEFASVPVTVGSDDMDNIIVTTSVGATARGVIVIDDGSAPTFKPSQVQVSANPLEPMSMMGGFVQPKINDDYSFSISGLFERRLIRGFVQTGGWYLKAVFRGADDVTDSGVDFVPGRDVEDLQVVLTKKFTDLSGLVTDDRNRLIVDASVVIFPANRERWNAGSRYLRTLRPDTQGRYSSKGLPPGEDYLVIAVANLEQGQGGDPEFLTRAREEAKPLTLNEGETKSVDVKLSKLTP